METTTTVMAPHVAKWIDDRVDAGDRWVILAGVPMRVVRRNLKRRDNGSKTAWLLRTVEGVAYRLMPYHYDFSAYADLAYAHDVIIDEVTYHVYVAPPDSRTAHALASSPTHAGMGAPVALEGGGRRYAVRRARAFDHQGKLVDGPTAPAAERTELAVAPEIAVALTEIAARRGVSLDVMVDEVVRAGVARLETLARWKRKEARRKRAK